MCFYCFCFLDKRIHIYARRELGSSGKVVEEKIKRGMENKNCRGKVLETAKCRLDLLPYQFLDVYNTRVAICVCVLACPCVSGVRVYIIYTHEDICTIAIIYLLSAVL